MDEYAKKFPDILAVDPTGCGCTECIIGEYVNEDEWVANATVYDVAAVVSGDVGNNTLNSTFDLIMTTYFTDYRIQDFVRSLKDELEREFQRINLDRMLP